MTAAEGRARVDVIVRTMADEARAPQLFRALDSIQSQQGALARPIVVVNGERYHEPVMTALRRRQGVLLHHFSEASAGRALIIGRELVTAPYFMFLDDDDHLVPYALKEIVPGAAVDVDWDVLVTNGYGYRQSEGVRAPWIEDLMSHSRNPLRSLMHENWLSPGNSLFRTASISADLLDIGHGHHAWTHIAFRLALGGKRLKFMNISTAVYNDTAGSMSKRLSYHEEELRLLNKFRTHPNLDSEVRAIMESKYRNTLHTMAVQYALAGKMGKAWRCHLRSLRPPYTLKYLLFSRKLLFRRRAGQ